MQKYRARFGHKYQDVTLLNSEAERNAFGEELVTTAERVAKLDKSLGQTVSRASRLFDLLTRHGPHYIPPLILIPEDSGYARFMQLTASSDESRRDRIYRRLLRSSRRRGFVRVPRPAPS